MGPVIKDTVLCQLSDSDYKTHPNDLKAMSGFMYRGTEVKFLFKLCLSLVVVLRWLSNCVFKFIKVKNEAFDCKMLLFFSH